MVSISLWRQKIKCTGPKRREPVAAEQDCNKPSCITNIISASRTEPKIKFPLLLDSWLILSPSLPNCCKEQSKNHQQAFLPECRGESPTVEPNLATFTLISMRPSPRSLLVCSYQAYQTFRSPTHSQISYRVPHTVYTFFPGEKTSFPYNSTQGHRPHLTCTEHNQLFSRT